MVYAQHKATALRGELVCPFIDPLLEKKEGRFTYVTLGSLEGRERIPSSQLRLHVRPLELFSSLLFLRASDLGDLRFLWRLYDARLCHPFKRRLLHVLRTFLLGHYYGLKLRTLAAHCDRAWVVVYYNAAMLGVVRAFRKAGKEVWDVQHGYVGPDHSAYCNTKAYSINSTFQPTGFLVWEQRFGAFLEGALGARWKSTDYLHIRAVSVDEGEDHGPQALYTLQWGIPVPDYVLETVQSLQAVQWVFRRHPMDKSGRHDLAAVRRLPNVRVVAPDSPLPQALARARLHVTFNSSVVHEAAILGVRSVFLDPHGSARFASEVSAGLAYPCSPSSFQTTVARLCSEH